MNLKVVKEELAKSTILYLNGEVDVYTAPSLKEELSILFEQMGQEVILDLSQVQYMDSTGLGVIIGGLKAAKKNRGELKLRNATDRLTRLFTITGLSEVIEIK